MDSLARVESLFSAALEKRTPVERSAYLREACGPDEELRQGVERLLAAHPQMGNFMESPAPALVATVDE
jgi:hypothetical protein